MFLVLVRVFFYFFVVWFDNFFLLCMLIRSLTLSIACLLVDFFPRHYVPCIYVCCYIEVNEPNETKREERSTEKIDEKNEEKETKKTIQIQTKHEFLYQTSVFIYVYSALLCTHQPNCTLLNERRGKKVCIHTLTHKYIRSRQYTENHVYCATVYCATWKRAKERLESICTQTLTMFHWYMEYGSTSTLIHTKSEMKRKKRKKTWMWQRAAKILLHCIHRKGSNVCMQKCMNWEMSTKL